MAASTRLNKVSWESEKIRGRISKIAAPLHQLTEPKTIFEWKQVHEVSIMQYGYGCKLKVDKGIEYCSKVLSKLVRN